MMTIAAKLARNRIITLPEGFSYELLTVTKVTNALAFAVAVTVWHAPCGFWIEPDAVSLCDADEIST